VWPVIEGLLVLALVALVGVSRLRSIRLA
jgi:hypothetical protein